MTDKDFFRYAAMPKEKDSASVGKYNGPHADVIIPAEYEDLPVTELGLCAFRNNQAQSTLRTVIIPKTVQKIDDNCFEKCSSLISVTFSGQSDLRLIGKNVFSGTKIQSIWIPKGVRTIGDMCFERCECLLSVEFEPKSLLATIGHSAFSGTNISEFVIPAGVQVIPKNCFYECKRLRTLTFENGTRLEKIENFAFSNTPSSLRVICPAESNIRLIISNNKKCKLQPEQCHEISEMSGRAKSAKLHKGKDQFLLDIDDYDECELIGSGGSGNVHRYTKNGESFAGKRIKTGSDGQRMLDREVQVHIRMASEQHPCIIEFVGWKIPDAYNHDYLIMTKFYPNGSLSDVMKNKPDWFDDLAKVTIVYGIASGMAHLHSQNVLHRDLKPANVIIDDKFHPRITDFGLSKIRVLEESETELIATPRYRAPESELTFKSDVYSFGVMLYEIVTGETAFGGKKDKFGIIMAAKEGKRPYIPPNVTLFSRDLITRCWDPDPKNRPSFMDICKDLEKHGGDLFQNVMGTYLRRKLGIE